VCEDGGGTLDLTPAERHAIVALITAGQEEIGLLLGPHEPADDEQRARMLGRLTRAASRRCPPATVTAPAIGCDDAGADQAARAFQRCRTAVTMISTAAGMSSRLVLITRS
jgi:hypothetical protein